MTNNKRMSTSVAMYFFPFSYHMCEIHGRGLHGYRLKGLLSFKLPPSQKTINPLRAPWLQREPCAGPLSISQFAWASRQP